MVTAVDKKVKKIPIIKKRTAHFKRHQSDRFMRVGESWRKPKGIDSRVRRRFKGQAPMPKIGYRSDKRTRYMLPNHLRKITVSNAKDLELLVAKNSTHYAAEIAHNVSTRNRIEMLALAEKHGVKVINSAARVEGKE